MPNRKNPPSTLLLVLAASLMLAFLTSCGNGFLADGSTVADPGNATNPGDRQVRNSLARTRAHRQLRRLRPLQRWCQCPLHSNTSIQQTADQPRSAHIGSIRMDHCRLFLVPRLLLRIQPSRRILSSSNRLEVASPWVVRRSCPIPWTPPTAQFNEPIS